MQLSKSDFLKFRVCPSYLWLWKHNPDLVPPESTEEVLQNKFDQGNQVEAIARQLFPSGVLVKGFNRQAEDNTKLAITEGASVLFQATVITDNNLLAMADVLEKDGDGWKLYEVKSSGEVKKDLHIPDMAFQRIAFEKAGYKITETLVIHLNKSFIRRGEVISPKEYFVISNVDEFVQKILPEVHDQIALALERMNSTEQPTVCPCRSLSRGKHCPAFRLFNPDVPEYSIYDVSRMQGKKLEELVDNEIFRTIDIPDDFNLSANQAIQVAVDKSGLPRVDKERIVQPPFSSTHRHGNIRNFSKP